MNDRWGRIFLSLLLGGGTGLAMGFVLGDPPQGTLIGLVLGAVYGAFLTGPDEKS